MALLVIIVLAVVLAGALVLAVIVASVRREDRRLSLKDQPATWTDAVVRRLLGAGTRHAEDHSSRAVEAGRR